MLKYNLFFVAKVLLVSYTEVTGVTRYLLKVTIRYITSSR